MKTHRIFHKKPWWTAIFFVVICAAWLSWPKTASYVFTTAKGQVRRYIVHEPPGAHLLPMKRPLVMVFHEGGKSPEYEMQKSGLNAVSDLQGFYVVYPEGTVVVNKANGMDAGAEWFDDPCCAQEEQLQFVRELLAYMMKTRNVDPKRVYATGVSRGGEFTYTIGCRLSSLFAAIAPISSTPTALAQHACSRVFMPMITLREIPKDAFANPPKDFESIFTYHDYDAEYECPVPPKISILSNIDAKMVIEEKFSECAYGEFNAYFIIDGRHGWPQDIIVGNRRVAAIWLVWRFLSSHRRS